MTLPTTSIMPYSSQYTTDDLKTGGIDLAAKIILGGVAVIAVVLLVVLFGWVFKKR